MYLIIATDNVVAEDLDFPEPDPPRMENDDTTSGSSGYMIKSTDSQLSLTSESSSATEWTYHKTEDNLHPNGEEQQMLWLMNRARSNPALEGVFLATTDLGDIDTNRNYFNVDLDVLKSEFAGYEAKPPAAFDARLYQAAKTHSNNLIDRDSQDHDGQFDAISDAGFTFNGARGNVFAYSTSGINAHGAFNIDWGSGDGTGMQTGRGHRQAVMSLDGNYTNVGLALVEQTSSSKSVGPLVVTGNYCNANTSKANHYNRFLVGTVFNDANENDIYDAGEGLEGVTVHPQGADFYAVTANSGGYAIPITEAGTYQVTFSGDALSTEKTMDVTIADSSVLLDLVDNGDSEESTSSETESASETETETETDSGVETGSETDTASESETETQTSTATQSEADTATATNTDTQSEAETDTASQTDTQTVTETSTATETQSSTATETGTETEDDSESEIFPGCGGGCDGRIQRFSHSR